MSFRFPQPANEDDFELFCLRFLRALWKCPTLEQYGKRGERQDGIDLIDMSGADPLRAVQCKHHEFDKTLPPSEIEDEVRKALGSSFPLGEYYILTTGRKTALSQKKIIEINRNHVTAGRFKVFLLTWAEIESRLSEFDDVTLDHVLRGDSGRSALTIHRVISSAMIDHLDRSMYSSESALDTALEAAKAAIEQHHLEVAVHKLEQLESTAPDKLQPQHWYQLKALRAQIFMDRGEWVKAGRELLGAMHHQSATERARTNECLGYELVSDREKAHLLATQLRVEFPQSQRLLAIWLRTAPPSLPFSTCEDAAGSFTTDCEDVTLALAFRALAEDDDAKAEAYARKSTELVADAPHGWFMLAQTLHMRGTRAPKSAQTSLLQEAETHYDKAIEIAHSRKMCQLEAEARFNRGSLRWLRGDPKAEADYLSAIDVGLPDSDNRVRYAAFLVEMSRFQDAIRELERVSGKPTGRHLFVEAAARFGRNEGDDRTVAQTLLRRLIESNSEEGWEDAYVLLAKWSTEAHSKESVEQLFPHTKLLDVNPALYWTLAGWLAISRGDTTTATELLTKAVQAVTPETARIRLFLLAQVLTLNNDDERALPLFERSVRPGVFDAECRKLLDCAQRLHRHDVITRVCKQLREAGETDRRLIDTEINVQQLYDPRAALETATQYLRQHPDDRFVTLWQSALALRCERPDLIISDLARLPTPSDMTPRGSALLLSVLQATSQLEAALQYAYAILREHFDDEFAHGQYIAVFLLLSPQLPQLAVTGPVTAGMAVCYQEEHHQESRWVVIEDALVCDASLDEIAPDSHLSNALLGKDIGDVATLSEGPMQPRTATIRELCHKFVFRFRDALNQFQIRFPNSSSFQAFHVKSADSEQQFDLSPIVKSLEQRHKQIEWLDNQYRTALVPIFIFAKLAGVNEFDTWNHLVSDPSLGIRCSTGQPGELREALDHIRSCTSVVVDLTALITLGHLDLLSLLENKRRSFVVSQSSYDLIRGEIAEQERSDDNGGHVFLTNAGTLAMLKNDPAQKKKYIDFLKSIRDAIRDYCNVRPCTEAALLKPTQRDKITEAVGKHNLESFLFGAERDAVLWSDDLVLGILSRTEFQTIRVWTQAVLFVAMQEGVISQGDYDRAVAKMVGWHYQGMVLNHDTLIAAAEVADWNSAKWPLPQVMKTLGNDAANPRDRLHEAAAAIRIVWRRDLPFHQRQAFLHALLQGIGSVGLVRELLRGVPAIFSVDFFAADEVSDCIRYWLRHPTGIVRM